MLADRRVRTLGQPIPLLAGSADQTTLGTQAARVLAENRDDLPFAALYLTGPAEGALYLVEPGVGESPDAASGGGGSSGAGAWERR